MRFDNIANGLPMASASDYPSAVLVHLTLSIYELYCPLSEQYRSTLTIQCHLLQHWQKAFAPYHRAIFHSTCSSQPVFPLFFLVHLMRAESGTGSREIMNHHLPEKQFRLFDSAVEWLVLFGINAFLDRRYH